MCRVSSILQIAVLESGRNSSEDSIMWPYGVLNVTGHLYLDATNVYMSGTNTEPSCGPVLIILTGV
jgi:hypothetical protein